MRDVDAILASGQHVDRKGRTWVYDTKHDLWMHGFPTEVVTPEEMRLKIIRDLHRATCPGLRHCMDHPVPSILTAGRFGADVYGPFADFGAARSSLAEAMDAARRMTGEQK